MIERPERTTVSSLLIRFGLLAAFLLLGGRLFQLQVLRGETFEAQADANRFREIEVPPLRGVIYDRNGEILARNRPSFVIAVTPADLPADDISTEVNELTIAIERVLRAMDAHTNEEVALSVAEVMFRRLGRVDFIRTVESQGIDLTFRLVNIPIFRENEEGDEVVSDELTPIPDLSKPLPLKGLVSLVKRAVDLGSQGSSFAPIPILDLVEDELALRVAEDRYRLAGVQVLQEPVRRYPFHEYMGHVLGFLGPIPALALENYEARGYNNPNERVGLNGLEFTYQDLLRGQPGLETIEVDILGRKNRTVGRKIEPVPGRNLRLSLDIRLQQKMHDSLAAMLAQQEAPHGAAIAMNPQTGAVLGLVSLPAYDNNIFSEGLGEEYQALEAAAREDPNRNPLINYAIGGLYPPGSTFKLATATGALAEGVITQNTVIADTGPLYLPNQFFPNDPSQAQEFVSWNHKLGIVHGRMTVIEALGLSNDIFFYWIGGGFPNVMDGLQSERLARWMDRFGYGSATGIDLPGEPSAEVMFVPDDQWKRLTYAESWTTGDNYNMSIGQGYVLGTPLQVLVSAVAVANGGRILQPQMVAQVLDADGGVVEELEPVVVADLPVSAEDLALVQEGMRAAVHAPYGTAPNAQVPGIVVAGKTGTAEFCQYDAELEDCVDRDDDGNLPFHAWYVTYAPFDDPEIAVVVFLYDGGEGSSAAAPVAQEILHYYFNEMDLPVEPVEEPSETPLDPAADGEAAGQEP